MSYGIPYHGSKNGIARAIVDFLPEGDTLVDLFAGGCAIAHAAAESGKWRRIIVNDINPMPTRLLSESIQGKHTLETHRTFISRADFWTMKDTSAYVRYCWSFGSAGMDYAYAREVEPWKHALHDAYVLHDYDRMEAICGPVPRENLKSWIKVNACGIKRKYIAWYSAQWMRSHGKAQGLPETWTDDVEKAYAETRVELREYLLGALRKSGKRACDIDRHLRTNGMAGHYFGRSQWEFPTPEAYEKMREILPLDRPYPWHLTILKSLGSLERLESLGSLGSLESLERLGRLERLKRLAQAQGKEQLEIIPPSDYRDVEIPRGAVIYCDIPYQGTACESYSGFDHAAFLDWAAEQSAPVYISSYSIQDERFVCVLEKQKRCQLQRGSGGTRTERLYTQAVRRG